jgi:hypothetical protein
VLYETAYGFSELRTYTHVFVIWLALLLIATVVLEILRRERMFALAALIASIGFAASLPILNVDAFIVRQNVQRVVDGNMTFQSDPGRGQLESDVLDISYFTELSADALPALVDAYHSKVVPAPVKDALGAALACIRYQRAVAAPDTNWRSYHLSRWEQARLLEVIRPELKGYFISAQDYDRIITTPLGKEYNCGYGYSMD